jgi:hypothetical protein
MSTWIAAALAMETITIAGLLAVALDIQAHKHVERLGGVNVWGYRGPVMSARRPNEIRIAVVGGNLAFGWGVAASETLAPTVRQFVALETDKPGSVLRPVTAVTLGATGLPPGQYGRWIEHFAYLQPDIVILAVDPRGHHAGGGSPLPDRASTAFALFGYAPILPLVVEEKGALLHSAVLQTLGSAAAEADHVIAGVVTHARSDAGGMESSDVYVGAIEAAVRAALRRAAGVVVVAPPFVDATDGPDHEALAAMISSRFADARRIRLVDLADQADMYDEEVWLGHLVFSTAGHAKAAEYVTPAVLDLIAAR